MPNARFNYALDVSAGNAEDVEVIHKAMPVKWNWSIDGAPLQLRLKAKEFDWKPDENQPLPNGPVKSNISTKINLVPYGCTKFRVTMFPVADSS
jgi:hypothetical protein